MQEGPGPRKILLLGVLFTSLSSILIRYTSAHPLMVGSFRMLFAALLMLPLYIRGRRQGRYGAPSRGDLGKMLLSGLFLGAHFATWISSLRLTSVASSVILVSTHPLIVLILGALLLHERVALKGWIALALVLSGTLLLSLGDMMGNGHHLSGDLLALAGAFFVAFYFLIGRSMRGRIDLVSYTTIVYASSLLLLGPLTGLGSLLGLVDIALSLKDLALCLALALFSTLLGHSLFNYALKYLPAGTVSMAILLEPFIASLLAMLLFQEIPPLLSLGGGVIVLSGIALHLVKRAPTSGAPVPGA